MDRQRILAHHPCDDKHAGAAGRRDRTAQSGTWSSKPLCAAGERRITPQALRGLGVRALLLRFGLHWYHQPLEVFGTRPEDWIREKIGQGGARSLHSTRSEDILSVSIASRRASAVSGGICAQVIGGFFPGAQRYYGLLPHIVDEETISVGVVRLWGSVVRGIGRELVKL